MDALRRYILDALKERDETLFSASQAAGLGNTFLWELMNKPGVGLGATGGKKLARWLGVPYAFLDSLEGRQDMPDIPLEEAVALVSRDDRVIDIIKSWFELSEIEREHVYSSLEAVRIRRQRRDQIRSEVERALIK